MKGFLLKILLFIFIAQLPILIEALLPNNLLTFRTGESLNAKYTAIYGTHYPNKNLTMTEVGGLAVKTPYQVKRKATIITDKLGYRNTSFIENPNVVLIGDSQTVGAGSDQTEIFSEQIKKNTGLKVYNLAPADPQILAQLIHDSIIKKPKLVIMEKIEREIPYFSYNMTLRNEKKGKIMKFLALDPTSQTILEYTSKYARNYLPLYIRSEVYGRGSFPTSIKDKSLFFYEGTHSQVQLSDKEIEKLADEYLKLKQYFDKEGIEFAFMPFPNKETIFYEHVPYNKQPDFLEKFIKALKKRGIQVINPTEKLTSSVKNNQYTYIKDDTHLNLLGMKIVSQEMIDFINSKMK